MATVDVINTTTTTATAGRSSQILSNEDFMKIMITELTHQDPLDPMSNQDLVNQMSTLQQMQASQQMSSSFENLMSRYDEVLLGQAIASSSGLIGELVSGVSTAGDATIGTVLGVSVIDGSVVLELDTGEKVRFENIRHMGGQASEEFIGQLVLGQNLADAAVIGRVLSVDISGDQVLLNLDSGEQVTLASTTPLNADNAAYLIGAKVGGTKQDEDGNDIEVIGTVIGITIDADGSYLNIDTGDGEETVTLPLTGLRKLFPTIGQL